MAFSRHSTGEIEAGGGEVNLGYTVRACVSRGPGTKAKYIVDVTDQDFRRLGEEGELESEGREGPGIGRRTQVREETGGVGLGSWSGAC